MSAGFIFFFQFWSIICGSSAIFVRFPVKVFFFRRLWRVFHQNSPYFPCSHNIIHRNSVFQYFGVFTIFSLPNPACSVVFSREKNLLPLFCQLYLWISETEIFALPVLWWAKKWRWNSNVEKTHDKCNRANRIKANNTHFHECGFLNIHIFEFGVLNWNRTR